MSFEQHSIPSITDSLCIASKILCFSIGGEFVDAGTKFPYFFECNSLWPLSCNLSSECFLFAPEGNEKIFYQMTFSMSIVNIERRHFRRWIPFVTLALAASEPVTNVRWILCFLWSLNICTVSRERLPMSSITGLGYLINYIQNQ